MYLFDTLDLKFAAVSLMVKIVVWVSIFMLSFASYSSPFLLSLANYNAQSHRYIILKYNVSHGLMFVGVVSDNPHVYCVCVCMDV